MEDQKGCSAVCAVRRYDGTRRGTAYGVAGQGMRLPAASSRGRPCGAGRDHCRAAAAVQALAGLCAGCADAAGVSLRGGCTGVLAVGARWTAQVVKTG